MAIAIATDQLLIDIKSWYHHLRMVQAHLDTSALAGMTPAQLDFCSAVVADLLGACEDAASYLLTETISVTAKEAGVGSGPSHEHCGGGQPSAPGPGAV